MQVVLDEGTVCADTLVTQGSRRVALEFVYALQGATQVSEPCMYDGAVWLRAAHMRLCGVHVVHVRIPRTHAPGLQPRQFVRGVMEQLQMAGLDVHPAGHQYGDAAAG